LLHYAGEKLALLGHCYQRLQVRDLPGTALLQADFRNAELAAACALVAQSDAVVIATPVYKAAYSGVLKAFLDLLPQDGLKDKLVLPLATGGSQSHMLALDYALRPVLSALGARHVLPSIYATDAQVLWSEQDGLAIDAGIAQRIADGVEHLSASLPARRDAADYDPVPFSQMRCSV
jgi:FMN reductase